MSENKDLFGNWVKALDVEIKHQDVVLDVKEDVSQQESKVVVYKLFKCSKIKGKPCLVCYPFSTKKCDHFKEDEPCTNTDCENHPANIEWFAAKEHLAKVNKYHDKLVAKRKEAWKEYTK